jgi:DNA polymerase I
MILSQITGPSRQGGHSLKSWGLRFEDFKGEWNDFSQFSWEMVDYCLQDVRITHKLYDYMIKNTAHFSKFSVRLEHAIRRILDDMEDNGFAFDEERAHKLYTEIKEKCKGLEEKIQETFPPQKVYYRKMYPRFTAKGEMHGQDVRSLTNSYYDKEVDDDGKEFYHLYQMRSFNPRSTSQIVERMEQLGWQPVVFNEPTSRMIEEGKAKGMDEADIKGTPSVCEENFETLPDTAPAAAKLIAEWFLLDKRVQKLEEWFNSLNPKTGCIHGRVFGCGAHTHRMTHRTPNMANISKVKTKKVKRDDESEYDVLVWGKEGDYSTDMRACFGTRDTKHRKLVGVDLSGIQLRAFAHYAGNKEYTEQILTGDIHSYNRGILDSLVEKFVRAQKDPEKLVQQVVFVNQNDKGRRNIAKTFIYAYLFGAGNKKVGQILGFPEKLQSKAGKFIKEGFVTSISGLDKFKKNIQKWADQGWMQGLDGRLIAIPSAHVGLSIALQSFEAIIMKYTLVLATTRAKEQGLDALLVGVIHDESQWDARADQAETLGKLVVECMEEAGTFLKSSVPLTGEFNVGLTWSDSH